MGNLSGNKIIITGGSLGIGLAVAEECAAQGASVLLVARNRSDINQALNKLQQISNSEHQGYELDVGDLNAVNDFAKSLKDNFGFVNGLVNCAGIYGPIGKTTEVSLGEFLHTIQINLMGTVQMCAKIAPLLKGNPQKKIVNFSGGGGGTPFPNYSAYACSKAAVIRFTENLALELVNDAVDVNCIAPGFVVTRLHQQTLNVGAGAAGITFFEKTKEQLSSGGVPAEKSAKLACFLLSQISNGITGKFISAPWDPWQNAEYQELLRKDKDFATLRRIDNEMFIKK